MTDSTLTHLYFLLDRSGSMTSIAAETRAGFDAFVAEQRTVPGRCRVSLSQFDDEYEEVYVDRDLALVPPLDLAPRGSTALLDSLGRLIVTAGERLAALPEPERPGTVVVGVMTDGYENASKDWTHPRIKQLIAHQTDVYGWRFMYLGADQDAIEEGMKMGFAAARSMTYARGSADKALASLSKNVGAYRAAKGAHLPDALADLELGFKDDQRDEAAGS
jgi:hypothetical protein